MAHQGGHNTPYKGDEKLVIAVDMGTTHTAVSYVHLYPGDIPEIKMVTKWPGQPAASGDSKIPTIVAYQNGDAMAFGAEAEEFVQDNDYEIAKWFKLYLHPDHMKTSNSDWPLAYGSEVQSAGDEGANTMEIPPLPTRVTLKKVYADLLGYLYASTREFFELSTPNGPAIWKRLSTNGRLFVVLATPNGWDASQQAFLRAAAVKAGQNQGINDDEHAIFKFVTEGEASVHYTLAHQKGNWVEKGTQFLVIDAGGSTVDSTLYECKEKTPGLVLEEVCASECVQAGGVFVDRSAYIMLQSKLKGSRYGTEEFISEMICEFEKKTKRLFDGSQENNVIHFGRSSDNDRIHGILKGKLSLSADEVASTYDDILGRIVTSVYNLLHGRKVKYLILVGGLGESPYLRRQLEQNLGQSGAQFVTINEPSKKAAAEGAAIWYLRSHVIARAVRFTFGISICKKFNRSDPLHCERIIETTGCNDGVEVISDSFCPLIHKDTVVNEKKVISHGFSRTYKEKPEGLNTFSEDIYAWSGDGCPAWISNADGTRQRDMRIIGCVQADLSPLYHHARQIIDIRGRKCWRIDFEICIGFGGTEVVARLQWKQGSKVCRGPATILPTTISGG